MKFISTHLLAHKPSLRTRRGGTTLEFAMIAPMFFLLTSMIIELGVILFTQAILDFATKDAARLIETRQVGATPKVFLDRLCYDVANLIPCTSLQYRVQSANSFIAMDPYIMLNASGDMADNGSFNPGVNGQDVLVQVAYNRPTLIPFVIQFISGTKLLISTVAFQNEP